VTRKPFRARSEAKPSEAPDGSSQARAGPRARSEAKPSVELVWKLAPRLELLDLDHQVGMRGDVLREVAEQLVE